jgi:shikimate dehydrogenase
LNRFGLLGETLGHSYSPQIHARLGNYPYDLIEIPAHELETFLRRGEYTGLNVTIPHKVAASTLCAELSDEARAAGCVNTLIKQRDGTWYGDNTDGFGFNYLLRQAPDIAGKTLILGSGGAAQTVRAVLAVRGVETVVISRTGENNYENITKHADAACIVNATPVGMYPHNGASPLPDFSPFPQCTTVFDLIYNPARTEFMQMAEERGIPAYGGLPMLVAQAVRSAELFTGEAIPDTRIGENIRQITTENLNIVLIGMPGCGKSTTGAALAKRTGKPFIDTDIEIEKMTGKPVHKLIRKYGETAFRIWETRVLRAACKERGHIIAVGGGVVTRPENRRILRQNSTVVYLDRDIASLEIKKRPLSRKRGVEALAAERLPLYEDWRDIKITVTSVEETVNQIVLAVFPS